MAKLFLRSGSLDAVLPLGENGQPVWLSALQLRETLRLRKQQQIADCLAIPQPNDAGDRLDWYSPISGKVTSWAAASDSSRSHALNQLVACQQAVADMCQRAQKSEKTSQKLFGALLAKAIQFPDQNFVYLVGGKPVLTFWGFVSLEKKNRQDPLDCLRAVEEDEPPLSLSKMVATVAPAVVSAPVIAAPEPAPAAPVAEASPEPVAVKTELPADAVTYAALDPASPPAPAQATAEPDRPAAKKPSGIKGQLLRYGWILPTAALLVVFGVQMKNYLAAPSGDKAAQPPAQSNPQPVPAPEAQTSTAAPASTEQAKPAPAAVQTPTLPVSSASVAPTQQPAATEPAAVQATPTEPAANATPASVAVLPPAGKDDLVLPPDAVKRGSTRFLNGNWRVIVGIKTPLTGKPPILRYQIKNGKGQALMTQGDGTVCRVDVYAGLMQSGNLVINSRTKARCSDGARYQMPELVCTQGATGAAACSGQYDADTVLPMTMKRESK
ncbi:SrfA family protein [Pantoea sp. MBD-2R]|uniref:SrfA family protein n=1 Tax=Pantoea sp. MBD-2R TaxID=3141540 RepID=UPI0031844B1D